MELKAWSSPGNTISSPSIGRFKTSSPQAFDLSYYVMYTKNATKRASWQPAFGPCQLPWFLGLKVGAPVLPPPPRPRVVPPGIGTGMAGM